MWVDVPEEGLDKGYVLGPPQTVLVEDSFVEDGVEEVNGLTDQMFVHLGCVLIGDKYQSLFLRAVIEADIDILD